MHGQTMLVTGAARGIGRALAEQAAARGATVLLTARSTAESPNKVLPGTLEEVRDAITGRGGTAYAVRADLATDDGVAAVLAAVEEHLRGRVDVLVNNAALSFLGPFLGVPARRWKPVYAVNLLSPVALTQAVLPGMLGRGHGAVLNLSTAIEAVAPEIHELAYTSSKLALEHVSVALHHEHAGRGVDVFCVRIDEVVPTEAIAHAAPEIVARARYDAAGFARAALDLLGRPDDAGRVLTLADLVARGLL